MSGGQTYVVDGVSFPGTGGYAPIGVQPVESAQAPSSPVSAPAPAAALAPAATQGQAHAVTPSAAAPSLTLDFSQGLAAGYVLDWRDPTTDQVLVQIPMRTAFQQIAPAGTVRQVGKTVDTNA